MAGLPAVRWASGIEEEESITELPTLTSLGSVLVMFPVTATANPLGRLNRVEIPPTSHHLAERAWAR